MPAERGQSAAPTRALLPILVIIFMNFAGFSLIIPLLPFYGRELHASPVLVTMLFAAYSFGGIFGEIWWGRVSDRRGRRSVLIWTTGIAALTYLAFAFVTNYWSALGVRVLTGFFSGTVGVCASYIADVTKPEQRARSMGLLGAALNLGFAIGPAVGGLLASPEHGLTGFRTPILVAAAVSVMTALWSAFVVAESHAPGPARPLPKWGEAFHFVGTHPLLARLFAIAFIGIGTFASMEAVFGLWAARNFSWTTHEVGLTFIAVGGTGFLMQIVLIGPATRRFGEARVIVAGLLLLCASMLLQPVLRDPIAAVALMSTLMGGHSIAFPTSGALISRSTSPDVQGSVNGLLMASNALSRIVVPPVFGFIYSAAGSDSPYFIGAAFAGLAVLIALQVMSITDKQIIARPQRASH